MNPLLQKPVADSASKSLSPLKFVRPPQTKGDNDYALVTVDSKKLDAEWAKDKGFYVGPQGTGDAIGGRYQRFIEWRRDNPDTPVEAPIVAWNEYTNSVSFTNGRHRFSVLRDQGYPKVQVLVPKSQLKVFRKMATAQKTAKTISPVYHGTPHVFDEFEHTTGTREVWGIIPITVKSNAFFFTPDKATAVNWAANRAKADQSQYVLECTITLNNPVDFRTDDWVWEDVDVQPLPMEGVPKAHETRTVLEALRAYTEGKMNEIDWRDCGIDIDKLEILDSGAMWKLIDMPPVMDTLRFLKYDGAIVNEGNDPEFGGISYAVFNKNQIKIVKRTKVAAADQGDIQNIVTEMMSVLAPGLPHPKVRIINQTKRHLGTDEWLWGRKGGQTWGDDNTTISVQKSVLGHEETLRRIVAHELCHHEIALIVAKPKLMELGYDTYKQYGNIFGPSGHGKEWREVAARFNAKYGKDFVSETSDQNMVIDEQGKEIFVLINQHAYGYNKKRLGWQWAVRLSPKAKEYLNSLDFTSGEFKLVKTTNHMFTRGRAQIKQYSGWNLSRTPEQETAVQKLWDEAPQAKIAAADEPDHQADYNRVREERVELYAKFIELADQQRGAPEEAMLKIQHDPLGAGVYGYAVEHTGDLTHRMNERVSIIWGTFGYDSVKNKAEKVLRSFEQGYGFEREMQGNLRNNYEYHANGELKGVSFEEAVANFKKKCQAYANAHGALKVYNHPQELARDAAVALGKWQFGTATEKLRALLALIEAGPEAWVAEASQGVSAPKTAKSGPHKNASTQINLPADAAAKVVEASNRVADEDLGADGREDEPHITIKYGVKDDVDLLSQVVAAQQPFNVSLGKTHVFEAGEISAGQSPIVVEAHAPELKALHDAVNKAMSTRKDDFDYNPHATLAYVKPATAQKYNGLDWAEGISFPVNGITLSTKAGERIFVPFGEPKTASHKTPPMSDTQYEPSGEYGQGQETNAYADIPERVKGEEDLPSLEELSPALFKTAELYGDCNVSTPDQLPSPEEFAKKHGENRRNNYAELREFFTKFTSPLTIYRALKMAGPKPTPYPKGFGIYWSWNEDKAIPYEGETEPDDQTYGQTFIFRAEVPLEAVDWAGTIGANMDNSMEEEITLRKGTPINVIGWRHRDKARWQKPTNFMKSVTAAKFIPPTLKDFYKQKYGMPLPRGKNERWELENKYDEAVGQVETIEFPLTVYRALEVPSGQQPNLDHTGVYWTTNPDAADAYWGGSSLWSEQGGGGKKGRLVMLTAEVLNEGDVNLWQTFVANFENPEEYEVTLEEGAQLRLVEIDDSDLREPLKNTPISQSKPKKVNRMITAASLGEYIYHVTYMNRLNSIESEGLSPGNQGSIGGPALSGHKQGRIFLAEAGGINFWLNRAETFAYNDSDNPVEEGFVPVVLRTKRTGQEQVDDEGTNDSGYNAYHTSDTIPSDEIQVWNGTKWAILAGTYVDESDYLKYGDKDGYLIDTPLQQPKLAYADASKNLPMRGQKGIGGQDFPVLEEEEVFPEKLAGASTQMLPDEVDMVPDFAQNSGGGKAVPKLERVPLFPEKEEKEKTAAYRVPKYLYHGTRKKNLDAILRDGLKAGLSEQHTEWGPSVYLACDKATAQSYAKTTGDWVVLQIDVSRLNKDLLRPDDWEFRDEWTTEEGEVPHSEKVKYGDNWANVPWEVSLQYSCQVAYLEDIPPAAIKAVVSPRPPYLQPLEDQQKQFLDAHTVEQVAEHFAITPEQAAKAKAKGVVKLSAKINPKLKTWFGASKVVNPDFTPRTVYHGSRSKWLTQFDLSYEGTGVHGSTKWGGIWFTSSAENAEEYADPPNDGKVEANLDEIVPYGNDPYYAAIYDINGEGIFEVGPFPTEEEAEEEGRKQAELYNQHLDKNTNVIGVYLKIVNPYITDKVPRDEEFEAAKKGGHDGIIANDVVDGYTRSDIFVVFSPNQVKSAERNVGTYDPANPSLVASKKAASFPSFQVWVKKNGGIARILGEYDVDTAETYGYGLEEPDKPAAVKRYEKELLKRALADFQERYENLTAKYQGWSFPMDVFRCISLPTNPDPAQQHLFPGTPAEHQQALEAIQYKGVGIYWSWDEGSAECHWGTGGASVTLHGVVNENNIDWEGTIYANMSPDLGDAEKEVRLIEGTQFELEGIQYDDKTWSQPPVKTVTAAGKKREFYYHATKATKLNSIAKRGLKPSEDPQWGGELGATSYGKVFFASNPQTAMYYAGIVFHDTLEADGQAAIPLCLRVRIPESVPVMTGDPADKRTEGAPVQPGQEFGEAWATQVIPPENIEVYWRDKWEPLKASSYWGEMVVRWRDPEDWEIEQSAEQGEVEVNGYYEDWEGDMIGDSVSDAVDEVDSFTMPKTAKGKKVGEVYLLHFDIDPKAEVPASREDAYTKKFHARHYLGFAEGVGGAQRRIEQHYQATSGVKLIDAIHAKGITFTVARIWEKKDRNFERQLKNQGGLSRHCPICKKLGIDRDSLYRKQVPAMSEGIQTVEKETQVAPAEPEHGPDFVEQEKVIPKTAYPSAKIAQEADEAVSHVFYIEVPPDARDAFWREPPEGKLEFWAFKGRPSVLPNETVYFTFDKVPVGETTVYKLEPPGQSACGETGDFLKYWKLLWLPSAFKKYASMIL